MSPLNRLTGIACIIMSIEAGQAAGTELTIRVVDQNGDPISDAVLESYDQPVVSAPTEIAIIDQINKRFVPMVIAVQKGQRVNFPNNDNIRHHVYSFSAIKQFSTELYSDIPGAPLLFDTPGVAVLGCNIHDSMIGYIYVSAWQHVAVSDTTGTARLSLPRIPAELGIWHPWSSDPDNARRLSTADLEAGGELRVVLDINQPEQIFGFRALIKE